MLADIQIACRYVWFTFELNNTIKERNGIAHFFFPPSTIQSITRYIADFLLHIDVIFSLVMLSLTSVQAYFTSIYSPPNQRWIHVWGDLEIISFSGSSLRKIVKNYKNRIMYIKSDLCKGGSQRLTFTVKLPLGLTDWSGFGVAWSQDWRGSWSHGTYILTTGNSSAALRSAAGHGSQVLI